MMDFKDIKFDCIYFKGDVPCVPNKKRGKICSICDEYAPVSKKILIIKLGAIGDVIRSTPLITGFRNRFPDCRITWVTYYPEILPANDIDEIYSFDFKSFTVLKNETFDVAVNLDKDKEACMMLAGISSKKKFGFIWNGMHLSGLNDAARNKLLTGFFDELSRENKKSYQQEIFEICEMDFKGENFLLEVDKDFSDKWVLIRDRSDGKKVIGLNTGCGKRWPTRLWPLEHWVSLIKLLQKGKFYPVLLGGNDEDDRNTYLSKNTGAYYPGFFNLKEFIAITAQCDLIVTAVSMTMHIATGLEKPLVIFNNIFNKNEFELYGRGKIIEPDTGCDCYYGNKCSRKKHCMEDLPPEKVFSSVEKYFKAPTEI